MERSRDLERFRDILYYFFSDVCIDKACHICEYKFFLPTES